MGFRDWLLSPLNKRMNHMAKTLVDVKAQTETLLEAVRNNTSLTDALKTAFNGLRSQVDDLKAQIDTLSQAGGASPDDLQGLSDQLGAAITAIDADSLAEAALAGTGTTVTSPPPEPAPEPPQGDQA